MNTLQSLFPGLFHRIGRLTPEQIPQFLLHFLPGLLFGAGLSIGVALARATLIDLLKPYIKNERKYALQARWVLHGLQAIGGWFIWVSGIYAAVQIMPYMEGVDRPAQRLYTLFIFIQLGFIIGQLLQKWTDDYTHKHRKTEASRVTMIRSMMRVAHLLIWAIVIILIMNNYGIDITAMVAGLGVGGLAAAFAFQNILKDIFGSFSIVFDKPFVIGDTITAGDVTGTVEEIGTKTTRLRALTGELVVISNNDILSTRIRNFGNQTERRVTFHVRIQYGTPAAKIEKIPTIIKGLVEAHKDIRFERSHFQNFTDYGLQFETIYTVTVADYMRMMDIQQAVNLNLYKAFEKEGIRFAVPNQNMLVTMNNPEPIAVAKSVKPVARPIKKASKR